MLLGGIVSLVFLIYNVHKYIKNYWKGLNDNGLERMEISSLSLDQRI
jgi:hypothetical protein